MSRSLRMARLVLRATSERPGPVKLRVLKAPPTLCVPVPQMKYPTCQGSTGSAGDGAGKGGGAGGSIREAGGAFGKMEAAREEDYFRREQARQIRDLKQAMGDMIREKIAYHERQMQRHIEGIKNHQERAKIDKDVQLHDIMIQQHQESINSHKAIIDHYQKQRRLMKIEEDF